MSVSEANIVDAFEAKSRFLQLLERVVAGAEITITRHGHPVARLIPTQQTSTAESRQSAILKMRELASRNRLKGLRVTDLISEGRR